MYRCNLTLSDTWWIGVGDDSLISPLCFMIHIHAHRSMLSENPTVNCCGILQHYTTFQYHAHHPYHTRIRRRPPFMASSNQCVVLQGVKYDDDQDNEDQKFYGASPKQGKRKRRRNRAKQIMYDDTAADTKLESSINILLRPISIVGYQLPAIYILADIIAINTLPTITWALTNIFFCVYFILGWSLVGDEDDENSANEGNNYPDDGNDNVRSGILPVASCLGAIVSGALLSPQGLVKMDSDSLSWSSLTAIISTLSVFGVGLALLSKEVKDLGNEEQRLEIKDKDDREVRNEKMLMDQWDDDLAS